MNPLLEQFLSESRKLLENFAEKLMQLENAPNDRRVIDDLFRCVHTLKGNSGLFTFPEMMLVLHAGEDLLGKVRSGETAYSRELADRLLDAMDFVGLLSNEIESSGGINAAGLADSLRALMGDASVTAGARSGEATPVKTGATESAAAAPALNALPSLEEVPEDLRIEAFRRCGDGESLHWITYQPARATAPRMDSSTIR
jgi:two-component system chemotaxis sensor kinase CheA